MIRDKGISETLIAHAAKGMNPVTKPFHAFRRPDLWDFNLIPISVSAANQFPEIGYE